MSPLPSATETLPSPCVSTVAALALFCPVYYPESGSNELGLGLAARYARLIQDGCDGAHDTDAARGCCLAVGGLPSWLLAPAAETVLPVLCATSSESDRVHDAELRRNAINGVWSKHSNSGHQLLLPTR